MKKSHHTAVNKPVTVSVPGGHGLLHHEDGQEDGEEEDQELPLHAESKM